MKPKTSSGKNIILTIVDAYSKWIEAYPMSGCTTLETAQQLEHYFAQRGVPKLLISDQGAQFTNDLYADIMKLYGVEIRCTTTYHPQSNGQCERANGVLIRILAHMMSDTLEDWDLHLNQALMFYRAAPQTSTGLSPFYVEHLRPMRLPSNNVLSEASHFRDNNSEDYLSYTSRALTAGYRMVEKRLDKAQIRQKRSYDKRIAKRQPKLVVGDRVWVYDQPAKQGPDYKLLRPYLGPFCIEQVYPTGTALVRRIDQPFDQAFVTNIDKLRRTLKHIGNDKVWDGKTWFYADGEYQARPQGKRPVEDNPGGPQPRESRP
jgi:transposase InsO family protein